MLEMDHSVVMPDGSRQALGSGTGRLLSSVLTTASGFLSGGGGGSSGSVLGTGGVEKGPVRTVAANTYSTATTATAVADRLRLGRAAALMETFDHSPGTSIGGLVAVASSAAAAAAATIASRHEISAMEGTSNVQRTSGVMISEQDRRDMYRTFQTWATHNYGDSGKTKTVTRRKYTRIIRILTGAESSNSDNAKFRFWVKAKGFLMAPPPPRSTRDNPEELVLYVPTKAQTPDDVPSYKRVAVVEDFFEIIYNVHVEMDGRGGKHAGQKRTYRAIAETYAFLPREAVTRFLMSCSDCQKRMHLSMETNNNSHAEDIDKVEDDPPIIDFSLPITTAYLNHIRHKNKVVIDPEKPPYMDEDEESMSSGSTSSSSSQGSAPSPVPLSIYEAGELVPFTDLPKTNGTSPAIIEKSSDLQVTSAPTQSASLLLDEHRLQIKQEEILEIMNERNGELNDSENVKPVNMKTTLSARNIDGSKGHPERKRRHSDDSIDSSTKISETTVDDIIKDDDDDNDDDDDDKMSAASDHDPDRLKSFNMFVRLFVDENLDRMVPISKQPKDKVQAILDACDRQFPEFHERSRKRIRTYLKSCRRMRRSKDLNGWEQLRPTPPHLTSATAEGILAQACDNESNNAKRMRMGLDPLAASQMAMTQTGSVSSCTSRTSPAPKSVSPAQRSNTPAHTPLPVPSPGLTTHDMHQPGSSDYVARAASTAHAAAAAAPPPQTAFRPPHEMPSPFFAAASTNGLFRPAASFAASAYAQHPAHSHTPIIQHTQMASQVQNGEGNGPTDLSMKKSPSSTPQAKNQLNPSEVATIKQLIAGYRESAAFLYRSAEELEQLLLQQN